jgi:hypothetical protein
MIKFNLNNFSNHQYPFSHSIFENVLNIKFEVILNELMKIQDEDFVFSKNSNFQKKELRACSGIFGQMMNELNSETFLDKLKNIYSFTNLTFDRSFDGGGLTITQEGGYLRYHADFPYSNATQKFRVLNAILYLSNSSINGGELQLLDYESGTVAASIKPTFGRLVVFPTSKYTIHGFNKVINQDRISINAYYYDDSPIDDRNQPSKTIWFNNFKKKD